MDAQQITLLVGAVNFGATLGGLLLLFNFGRKTLMVIFNACMAVTLVVIGFASLNDSSNLKIAMTLAFICFFEFSSGPIVWLYMAEIMQDKATSVATVMNWTISLIVSATIPSIVDIICGKEIAGVRANE